MQIINYFNRINYSTLTVLIFNSYFYYHLKIYLFIYNLFIHLFIYYIIIRHVFRNALQQNTNLCNKNFRNDTPTLL